ncbi:calcineurin-like phosphoesterase C-terminal domain-containing protein [Ereboglobus luteus]|uniref:Metallophosphoesterase n=1 Tax=Ereboglobus luteus TaxID=1796921 RepID=A0A2U8E3X1_9BACT|nr:calcineurin-like phosphoesterase family protein [Ereboglobus luteus]AWI09607.1 hypothetical protein CKA38_10435 [Ereboglobus luteus]
MHTHHPKLSHARFLARIAAAFLVLAVGTAFAKVTHPDITPAAGIDLYGTILDDVGAPVAGVVVSDGFQCVATDAKGVYQMKRNPRARVVYYSTPAEYVINTTGKPGKGGLGQLYAKLGAEKRYNFDLTRLPAPETEFTLIGVGDPQVRYFSDLGRFKNETVADIREFARASRLPCYAILLGDIGFDTMHYHQPMREIADLAEIPYFAVIGNHDHDESVKGDDHKASAGFEAIFGPVNFSFNRGGVHIIGMDDIIYNGRLSYKTGITDEQIEWLRQSLSFVPKDKIIVLAYHAPLRESGAQNREKLMKLFEGYAEVHILAGHTHYHENYIIKKPIAAYEHILATACGAWWRSTLNVDGAPNGFGVFTFNGNKVADWYFKAVGHPVGFQMRLYPGDMKYGGPGGKFSYGKTANDIVVDVWNADPEWKIVAYENGVEVGPLKKLPRVIDAYSAGYHVGVVQRSLKSYGAGGDGKGTNRHLYIHTKKDPNARVEIHATDRFGKTYVESELTTDVSEAAPPLH